jgi:hypothetical protein
MSWYESKYGNSKDFGYKKFLKIVYAYICEQTLCLKTSKKSKIRVRITDYLRIAALNVPHSVGSLPTTTTSNIHQCSGRSHPLCVSI